MTKIFDDATERQIREKLIKKCERYATRFERYSVTVKSEATKRTFAERAQTARRQADEHRDRLRAIDDAP